MLFSERQRFNKIMDSESKGNSVWTEQLDPAVRNKLQLAVVDLHGYYKYRGETTLLIQAVLRTRRALGRLRLGPSKPETTEADAFAAIQFSDEDIVFSFLEALVLSLSDVNDPAGLNNFMETVKEILLSHRVSYDFLDGQFIPFESREMHQSVVAPTLTLLGGSERLAGVEKAYRDALDQIHEGNPENSVTDAGTALQEALRALGCTGNSLKPLAKAALKEGILAGHDIKLIDWVGGDRSNTGDAHNASPASVEDAWLTVHIVGAIILRITHNTPRPTP